MSTADAFCVTKVEVWQEQVATIALANLGPSILGEEKPALGSTRDGATEACG